MVILVCVCVCCVESSIWQMSQGRLCGIQLLQRTSHCHSFPLFGHFFSPHSFFANSRHFFVIIPFFNVSLRFKNLCFLRYCFIDTRLYIITYLQNALEATFNYFFLKNIFKQSNFWFVHKHILLHFNVFFFN